MKKLVKVGLLIFGLVCTMMIGGAKTNAASKDMYRLYNPNSVHHQTPLNDPNRFLTPLFFQ